LKRFLDIVLSGFALLVLAPVLVLVAVILRLTGEGEVFYRQIRIGTHGREFHLLKFVTMLKDSPNIGTGLLTTRDDPRVLPVGSFLRRTKINELPQLMNVFRGDMAIIGPRPQARPHFELYSEEVQKVITQVRPGLSGIGSIVFRNEEAFLAGSDKSPGQCYAEDIVPYKGDLECWYVENQSLFLDFRLVILTCIAIVLPNREYHQRVLKDLPELPAVLADTK